MINRRKRLPELAVFGFLLPNFLGFLAFTFLPVLVSLGMAFTNWTLKPAVEFEVLGLRNFNDLLGVRAMARSAPAIAGGYVVSSALFVVGLIGALWANVAGWPGRRAGGGVLTVLGATTLVSAAIAGAGQGVYIAGFLACFCGVAVMAATDGTWRLGRGTVPVLLLAAGALGLWLLHNPMWSAYEPRDFRFWKYLYNTIYLMLGIPFSIAGSLALALLLSDEITPGGVRMRIAGALLCLVLGAFSLVLVWGLGYSNIALLAGVFWALAAAGMGCGVVTFRTVFYLPTFTAGVALMILWKTLYNPAYGPLNQGLTAIFSTLGLAIEPPKWLASVAWAKPALMIMGVWTAVGGMNMLLYLAGLSNVPKDLIDAAEVDGAGRWAKLRHVTWPQLAPTTFFIVVMSVIGGMQGGFDQAYVMTGGGPDGSTTTLAYYIYTTAFEALDFGKAAAISWILFAVIFVATALNWQFGKQLEVEP